MRVYISGPITGYENKNLRAFLYAAGKLSKAGHEPLVPHNIDPWPHSEDHGCPLGYAEDSNHTSACYLRGDLAELLKCHALFMLRGWEASVGARLEHSVAAHCGMKIYYEIVPEFLI